MKRSLDRTALVVGRLGIGGTCINNTKFANKYKKKTEQPACKNGEVYPPPKHPKQATNSIIQYCETTRQSVVQVHTCILRRLGGRVPLT